MTLRREDLLQALRAAFPARVVRHAITSHECAECAAIQKALRGQTWHAIPSDFAETFSGSLPLLSPDAYNAFLPVWLRAAIEQPDSEAAAMVTINVGHAPSKFAFTSAQATVVVDTVEYVARNNMWGADDDGNVQLVAAVRAQWSDGAG